jgi:Ca2+-binding RTX toxin-like protein
MTFQKVDPSVAGGTTSYLGTSGTDSTEANQLTESSNVFINGRLGTDTLKLANISGNFTNYTLKGGQGNDDIVSLNSTSSLGSSFVNLNMGDDAATFNNVSTSRLLGGKGVDTIRTGLLSGSTTLNGNKGNDYLDVGGLSASSLFGGQGADTIFVGGTVDDAVTQGNNDDDTITIRSGTSNVRHTINGNIGNDTINVNAIASFTSSNILGGTGNDSVNAATSTVGITSSGENGNDSLSGGTGADVFNGNDGTDQLTGSDGTDTLSGNAGADTLFGGNGADTLNGNRGDDFFSYATTNEATGDTLTGGADGQTNGDTLVLTGALSLAGITNATILTNAQIENVRIDGAVAVTFNGSQLTGQAININDNGAGNATIDVDVADATAVDLSSLTFTAVTGSAFSSGNDVVDIDMTNAAANATITGTSLNDNMQGNNGADTLLGAGGNDTFGDSAGNDTITGGLGSDNLNFTTGNDRAIYTATNEVGDSITGFQINTVNEVINFGAGIFDGANYTDEASFATLIAIGTFGGGGGATAATNGDLLTNNADSTVRTAAQVDTLLAAQNAAFNGAVLFATDNGADTQIWYDSDMDTDGGGSTLLATLIGIGDANTVTLDDFLIT